MTKNMGCGIAITAVSAVVIGGILIGMLVSGSSGSSGGQKIQPTPGPGEPGLHMVGSLTCDNFETGKPRKCSGTVINNTDKTATNPSVMLQWKGSADFEYGTVEIHPLLPQQRSPFSIVTLHSNPQLRDCEILFLPD